MNAASEIGFALLIIAILHFNPSCAWAGMGNTASALQPFCPTKSIPIPDDCAKLACACMNARPLQALPVAETSNAGGEIASLGFPHGFRRYLRPATPVPPLASNSDLSIEFVRRSNIYLSRRQWTYYGRTIPGTAAQR